MFISLLMEALPITDLLLHLFFFLLKQLFCQRGKKVLQKIYIEENKNRKRHLKLVVLVNTVESFLFLDYLWDSSPFHKPLSS